MKIATFVISLTALCRMEATELTSPNGQYKIEYEVEPLEHETNVELKNAKTGKVIKQTISYGYYIEEYHEIAWSPDSRYLAVISRGTRTSSQVEVFSFIGDTVEEVTMPSPKLSDGTWTGGRNQFVKHLKWEGTTLKYYCFGDKFDGAGNLDLVPEDWYHFDIAMRFGGTGEDAAPKVISVAAAAPKWQGEQDGAGQPATPTESKSDGDENPNPEAEGRSR